MWVKGRAAIAFVVACYLGATSRANADIVVLESNVLGIEAGSTRPDGWVPTLPAGGLVRVLLCPSRETRVFEAPQVNTPSRSANQPIGGLRGPSGPSSEQLGFCK